MPLRNYLPSSQFVLIVASIAASGGLILAAQLFTSDTLPTSSLTSSTQGGVQGGAADWKAALYQVQGTSPLAIEGGESVQASLSGLFADAESSNITSSVGRSLLLNLSEAKAQGLGSDIPTQEKILAEATKKLQLEVGKVYTIADLAIVASSPESLHAYGNSMMEVLGHHPAANVRDTYVAFGTAVDTNDGSTLADLDTIGAAYAALAAELRTVVAPQTLSPLHLGIVNNFNRIAESFDDMATILEDPLRGFAGVQIYNELTGETNRMLTSIAISFAKNGILFEQDELGSAWNFFLSQ